MEIGLGCEGGDYLSCLGVWKTDPGGPEHQKLCSALIGGKKYGLATIVGKKKMTWRVWCAFCRGLHRWLHRRFSFVYDDGIPSLSESSEAADEPTRRVSFAKRADKMHEPGRPPQPRVGWRVVSRLAGMPFFGRIQEGGP